MSALSDSGHAHTLLDEAQIEHLQRLVGEWQLLSDLSFADLLLWVAGRGDDDVPVRRAVPPDHRRRPPTSTTRSGELRRRQPRIAAAHRAARGTHLPRDRARLGRRPADPPRGDPGRCSTAEVIAVLGRDAQPGQRAQPQPARAGLPAERGRPRRDGRRRHLPGRPERLEEGAGPARRRRAAAPRARRHDHLRQPERAVGVPPARASPATCWASRSATLTSTRRRRPVRRQRPRRARSRRRSTAGSRQPSKSRAGERPCCSARCRSVPRGETLGALVLMQDVTELRRRDRQILSKDATIREIHHRVKNNLQTVAALLRLQARRVAVPEARTALEESMRRVSSIALVHETLSVVGRRGGRLRRGRRPAAGDARRRHGRGGAGRRAPRRHASASCRPRRRPRWCWCSPSWCRTRSSTAFADGRRGHRRGRAPSGARGRCRCRSSTTVSGCRPIRRRDQRPARPADRPHAGRRPNWTATVELPAGDADRDDRLDADRPSEIAQPTGAAERSSRPRDCRGRQARVGSSDLR